MDRIKSKKIRVFAKINLGLSVGERKEGLHALNGVCSSISLYDELSAKSALQNKVTYTDGRTFPHDSAQKALTALSERFSRQAEVNINKGIWVESGLGGSAADAVGTCAIYKQLFACDTDKICDSLYSDAAVLRVGGTNEMMGTGSEILHLSPIKAEFLLLKPYGGVNTALCYKLFDELGDIGDSERVQELKAHLYGGDMPKYLFNDLTKAAEVINPNLSSVKGAFAAEGIKTTMSGSGSALYHVISSPSDKNELTDFCNKALLSGIIENFAFVESVPTGIMVL